MYINRCLKSASEYVRKNKLNKKVKIKTIVNLNPEKPYGIAVYELYEVFKSTIFINHNKHMNVFTDTVRFFPLNYTKSIKKISKIPHLNIVSRDKMIPNYK